jgi:hypothetical protein
LSAAKIIFIQQKIKSIIEGNSIYSK